MNSKAQRRYRDLFQRAFVDTRRWNNRVTTPSHLDTHQFGALFADCFSHHNDIRFAAEDNDTLTPQHHDPRRMVRKNNLTAFFQNGLLKGTLPSSRQAPLYESPNLEEEEVDLGPPTNFQRFFEVATGLPFSPTAVNNPTLGENRITFLVGEIGMGKTFLVSQLVQRIYQTKKDYADFTILPVYFCFENARSQFEGITIAREFVRQVLKLIPDLLYQAVGLAMRNAADKVERPRIEPLDSLEVIGSKTSRYIHEVAATHKVRFVLILDNLDVLHYQNSRYFFFPEHYSTHRQAIEEQLSHLVYAFVDQTCLGDAGLCCLFVARYNVAKDSRFINNPALPRRPELKDHLVFQLGKIDPLDVVASRLELFRKAAESCSLELARMSGLSFKEKLSLGFRVATASLSRDNLSDGLRRISELSHHGVRSLVGFLGDLRLDLINQEEVVQRLFQDSPWILERLYIANLYQRYSQGQQHFPNLFLVDSTVSEDKITSIRHSHTYWLKYLLLRRIGNAGTAGISVQSIIDEFHGDFKYGLEIVRLCLGSLAMVSESRCIEIVGAARADSKDNLVRLTSRGKVLIGRDRKQAPYCFQFSYLQLIVDDYLMSLPKPWVTLIACQSSLSYAVMSGELYQERMRADLRNKLPATLTFVRVLEAAWTAECLFNKRLAESAASIGPDFDQIYVEIEKTIDHIVAKAVLKATSPRFE